MSHIFISYARKDVEFAQKLNTDLQRQGVVTWIDELGIRSGEDWPDRIATAINNCMLMLVILSPDSANSKWVERELTFADQHGKRVLPLLHKPTELPESFVLRFGNVQRADFTRGSYEANLDKLLTSIEQVLGATPVKPLQPRPVPVTPKPAQGVMKQAISLSKTLVAIFIGIFAVTPSGAVVSIALLGKSSPVMACVLAWLFPVGGAYLGWRIRYRPWLSLLGIFLIGLILLVSSLILFANLSKAPGN